jgi:SAM-dependent methyltransferase
LPENESQPVRLSEFLLDKSADIWVPPASSARGAVAFSYTDGAEEETRLLRVLREATDLSDNASTLLSYVNDWPSHYHLAPGRANAIRALDLPHDIQILELGAGCGALSRHLGENYKVVHSVEGSAFRSAICRARCAGLSNVKVHCADFSDIALDPVYDVVILNGVLEYAPSFFRNQLTSDPAESLIRFAKSALREGGILVIGIENTAVLKSPPPVSHIPRPKVTRSTFSSITALARLRLALSVLTETTVCFRDFGLVFRYSSMPAKTKLLFITAIPVRLVVA